MSITVRPPHTFTLSILISLLLLASCGTPTTQYYVLDSISHKPIKKNLAQTDRDMPSVAIRQVEIPQYLDRPRMVNRDSNNHLHIAEYQQWGGRLRDNIMRTLADNLSERLTPITVNTAPFPGTLQADISLLIDIRQFELLSDGYLHLKVRWHILKKGEPMKSHQQHLQSKLSITANDYAAQAAAMSLLLSELADDITKHIKQNMQAKR